MKNDFAVKLSGLILAIIIVVSFLIYSSYAFLSVKITGTGKSNKAVAKSNFNVEFTKTDNINLVNAELINDTDDDSKAKTTFNITLKDISSAKFDVYLKNLYVSSNLQSKYLKWELIDLNTSENLGSGDFTNCTSCSNGTYQNGTVTKTLKSNLTLTKNTTRNIQLRLWLSQDSTNQNSLASGKLSGKVAVSVYYTT